MKFSRVTGMVQKQSLHVAKYSIFVLNNYKHTWSNMHRTKSGGWIV